MDPSSRRPLPSGSASAVRFGSLSSRLGVAALAAALLAACAGAPAAPETSVCVGDPSRAMADLRVLAADSMEGRGTGTRGIERARRFLLAAFGEAGLQPFPGGYARPFDIRSNDVHTVGVNLVGYVEGRNSSGPVMVVTAHYDHVGMPDGGIYNGADDNASGTAALLALARHVKAHPPEHTVVLAALDAEEIGLLGAKAFLANPPIARERIALNVNMDMVGRNEHGELYAAGAYHYPFLRPVLEDIAADAPVQLRLGHDSPELSPADDWTQQSDHGAFHAAGIPFVYFGVEDHPDYHRPTDDAERIEPAFFLNAITTVISAVEALDEVLDTLTERN